MIEAPSPVIAVVCGVDVEGDCVEYHREQESGNGDRKKSGPALHDVPGEATPESGNAGIAFSSGTAAIQSLSGVLATQQYVA
jgi:hypothetical protein